MVAAMTCAGVSWYLPPNGMNTEFAPIEPSNRSTRPRSRQIPRVEAWFNSFSFSVWPSGAHAMDGTGRAATSAVTCLAQPLVFRKPREISTMVFPFQVMHRRFLSVTVATATASMFSLAAAAMNASASFARTTTAIRSCDSEIASSVPSSPSYFLGTASRLMSRPSASSPIATDTPPAPKSLQRRIMRVTSPFRNRRWILRSSGGLPFCTSAPQVSSDSSVCFLEEPVAPPQPSRPVLPPSRMTISPASGTSRMTFSSGAAPTTAPISIRLAT